MSGEMDLTCGNCVSGRPITETTVAYNGGMFKVFDRYVDLNSVIHGGDLYDNTEDGKRIPVLSQLTYPTEDVYRCCPRLRFWHAKLVKDTTPCVNKEHFKENG